MTSRTHFGKLEKYDLELGWLEQHKETKKRHKNISLVESSMNQQEGNSDEDDNITLLVNKYRTIRFGQRKRFVKKKETSTLNQNFTCFEYGK